MRHDTVLVKVCSQPSPSHHCLQPLLQGGLTVCQNCVTSVSRSHAPSLAGMSFLPFLPPCERLLRTSQLLWNQFQKIDSQKKRHQCVSIDYLPSCLICFTLLWRKIEKSVLPASSISWPAVCKWERNRWQTHADRDHARALGGGKMPSTPEEQAVS